MKKREIVSVVPDFFGGNNVLIDNDGNTETIGEIAKRRCKINFNQLLKPMKIKIPVTVPAFVEVDVPEEGVFTDEYLDEAKELFRKSPRDYTVYSFEGHKGIADPNDVTIL